MRLATDDFTIRTALLEKRFIFGDAPLAETLRIKLRSDLFEGTAREFIEAKLAERDVRHQKHTEHKRTFRNCFISEINFISKIIFCLSQNIKYGII